MNSARLRLTFLGLMLGLGWHHAAAAAGCEANFKREADTGAGTRFSTFATVPGLDARNAIAQLKQIAAGDGFLIGDEHYTGSTGQLTIQQQQSDRARGFAITLTANQDAKTLSVATTLPPGMQAAPEAIRGGMCGMLGRVDMSRNAVNTGVAATAPASPGDAFPGAPAFTTCTYNFRPALDGVTGRHYTTWLPIKALNPADAAARLTQAATAANLSVTSNERHGTLTEVTLVQPLPDQGEKRAFPIRFMLEESLGVISVVARLNPKQEMDDDTLRKEICSLVAAATAAPPGESKEPPALPRERKLERWHAGIDWLINRAVVAGKSLVIVPAINLDRKYTGDEAVNEKKWAFRTDVTATTIWQNKANARDVIRVGPDEPFNEVGLHGYVSTFVAGNAQYFVYIVNPGTYTVAGNTYETTADAMSQLGTQQKPGRSPLGQIALLPKKNTDFIQSQEWFNAQFRDREVTDTYCSSVFVQSGGCAFWATEKRTVSEMTEPAGWKTVTREKSVDGLAVSTRLKREFASFSVAAGEAVVIDGLYPTPPNADYDKQACEIVSGQIQCDLTRYTLTRIPADMAHVQGLASDPGFYPRATRILSNARYRPLKLLGKPGELRSVYGQDYSLGVR
ncbi:MULTISPECIES: hypothetical protein [unclassified Burkholderia]|uniref:hypothetical protein n=1 Tax=unclassified Burkholderia TaxID=2613784 RepID=UPI001423DEAB|nr:MULTISPECIES: hypothetical protein [unclassified Burkholderia]NIE55342.1 hypothetical protein [Burkholderia sp. Ap-955]NIF12166.1 hypothetical protein [Burkholderia sp. Ax-1735]NIG05420.1 hypothetical protein [Burkholderia sp. Tr-849]